tara:strand:- start:2510 stop:2707 length:198 start_codon:yes stop_codon:yes gene_type:complete
MTQATKLLVNQVNDNLKFLRKVKPMNEKDIKDFIHVTIGIRLDVSQWPWNQELVNQLVDDVYNNL